MQMKKRLKILSETIVLTIAVMLFSVTALAQNVVTGKVTDAKKATPLPGVTVLIKGSKTATQTGSDGTFKITVPANSNTLEFTSVGYASQEAIINGAVVNISL